VAVTRGKRQPVLTAVAAVLFIAAGVVLYLHFRRTGPGTDRTSWGAYLECADCGHKFGADVQLAFPIKAQRCSKCGKEAAWELRHCTKCNVDFLPEMTGNPPRPVSIPKCPKCGSDRAVTSLMPDGTAPAMPEASGAPGEPGSRG
jgi:hypothetical protein